MREKPLRKFLYSHNIFCFPFQIYLTKSLENQHIIIENLY